MGINLYSLAALLTIVSAVCSGPIVNTNYGPVEGFVVNALGIDINAFTAIPYAKPPVGDLRFKRSEPIEPWTEVYEATQFKQRCSQPNDNSSGEDCLHLHVYVPVNGTQEPKNVFVYIHGGAYRTGSGNDFIPLNFLAYNDLIVVTVNYRLGPLGFLYFGTEDAPGNQGLWDQHLAIVWVKENIAAFGGDPDQITINGGSAGSASTSAQVASLTNAGLFRSAVLNSGAVLNPWSFHVPEVALTRANDISQRVGCSGTTPDDLIPCLRQSSITDLINAESNMYLPVLHVPFEPTIDGVFYTDHPKTLLKTGQFNVNVTIWGGCNAQEGSVFALELPDYFFALGESPLTQDDVEQVIAATLVEYDDATRQQVREMYRDVNDLDNGDKNRDFMVDLIGDYLFLCTNNEYMALAAGSGATVYSYFFTHRTSTEFGADWLGSTHVMVGGYEFGDIYFGNGEQTDEEKQLSFDTMAIFTSHIKTGRPSSPNMPNYPVYSADQASYVELTIRNYSIGVGPRRDYCDKLLPLLNL